MVVMRAKALVAAPPTQQQQLMASAYPFSPSPKGGGMGPLSHNYLLRAAHLSNPLMVDIRVGVIIGKAEETIRYIQLQSGAKIQVTRDHEAEPGALTRQVELSGNPEQISKAEQLIKEVLAEADVGSSGAGSGGQKYNATQQGAETFQMKISNNKVGLIIGKGGETI
ncbi:Far upstream element-binding protein 2 [Zea mays]|uniref:Far upstream element-binding protein 2 n=1 Tax=Zea mays TaxID=4577 RepID=A0A3L6DWJ8_MAIZE|nr:Far upstream element-binding protein 2 [Zea mays]